MPVAWNSSLSMPVSGGFGLFMGSQSSCDIHSCALLQTCAFSWLIDPVLLQLPALSGCSRIPAAGEASHCVSSWTS